MKKWILILSTSCILVQSLAQSPMLSMHKSTPDSGSLVPTFQKADWWQIVSKENVSYKCHNLQLSKMEKEILNLEAECTAMKERDTLMLIRLWARDFTPALATNRVVSDKVGLPLYTFLSRMIESIYAFDEQTVYTSGYEVFQILELSASAPKSLTTRKYHHLWIRTADRWKLTTKTIE